MDASLSQDSYTLSEACAAWAAVSMSHAKPEDVRAEQVDLEGQKDQLLMLHKLPCAKLPSRIKLEECLRMRCFGHANFHRRAEIAAISRHLNRQHCDLKVQISSASDCKSILRVTSAIRARRTSLWIDLCEGNSLPLRLAVLVRSARHASWILGD